MGAEDPGEVESRLQTNIMITVSCGMISSEHIQSLSLPTNYNESL